MITLPEAIDFARSIEAVLKPIGYHCALGGSCLHAGQSEKDVDIFVYPHTTTKLRTALDILAAMANCDLRAIERRDHEYDAKEVWMCAIGKTRIDIFFVK